MNQPLVLVVGDNATLRLNLTAFLEESSFAVAQAASAEDALVLVDREHPEIVILDMILPRSGEWLSPVRSNRCIPTYP